LAIGEARIVKFKGPSLALYKDENGVIFVLSPTCPHTNVSLDETMPKKAWIVHVMDRVSYSPKKY
jgi:nitrite reductase/ring-hydroxylating ferredoxin subunit